MFAVCVSTPVIVTEPSAKATPDNLALLSVPVKDPASVELEISTL